MIDCLIVGAGTIGLSLAYELARHGKRVRVIDRREPARESSWAGAGILPPANRATAVHPIDQLRALSHELHAAWSARLLAETGIDTGYRRCGGIYLARTIGEASALHAWIAEQRELGIVAERSPHDTLREIEPELRLAPGMVAYRLPDEAQIRNPRYLRALQLACAKHQVCIDADLEMTGHKILGGRLVSISTNHGELAAERFCFTAGAWTFQLLASLGFTTGIFPMRGQIVLYRTEQPLLSTVINEGPRYLVPRDDGRLLAGSTEEEAGFDATTTESGIAELQKFAVDLVPSLAAATIEKTWAGLRPATFDGFPYLGAVPGLENAFVAAGHYRSGLWLSPGTAVVMSELIRGEPPSIDLTPFRVGRG